MKRIKIVCIGLWLSFYCVSGFSASSNDDEIEDFLDNQVNVLNAILGGDSALELPTGHEERETDNSRLSTHKASKNNKEQQHSGNFSTKTKQNPDIKDKDKGQMQAKEAHGVISSHELRSSQVFFENSQGHLKPFNSIQSKKRSKNLTDQQYRENFGREKSDSFVNTFGDNLNIFTEYVETDSLNFSRNPFLVDNNRGNFQLAYNEGIITNSKQLKLLAYNLFGEETLEDLLLAKHEFKSLINQADSWIKEVIFDDNNWRLEDAIYGSTAFMFIYDSSVMRFLRRLDGGSENLEQIKDKFNIENGTTDGNQKLYAEDSVLARSYYSILEFWKQHARTIIYLLLSIVIIKELTALVSKSLNSRNKAKRRRKYSKKHQQNRHKQQTVQAYAGVSADGEVDAGNSKEKRQKYSSRRHYSSRRRRPKRSFVRKFLDDIFVNSTHKK